MTIAAAYAAHFPTVTGAERDGRVIEWEQTGLSPADAAGYMSAGCFRAGAAFELSIRGHRPEVAGMDYRDGMTIGYAVANGDLSPEHVETILMDRELDAEGLFV